MENNLDKYFRDNLHDRHFEMKEEFWLGAEQLLAQQEERRKRRGLFWWFGGGSAIVALALAGWFVFGKTARQGQVSQLPTAPKTTQTAENEVPPAFVEANGLDKIPEQEKAHAGTTAENRTVNSGSETNALEKTAALGSAQSAAQTQKGEKRPQPFDNQSIVTKTSTAAPAADFTQNQTSAQPAPTIASTTGQQVLANEAVAPDQAQPVVAAQATKLQNDEEMEHLSAPNHLPVLGIFVKNQPKTAAPPTTTATKTGVAKQRPFHWGFLAAQHVQPSPDSGEMARIGYRTGLVARLDLAGNWYLASGLQYQRRSGTFAASKTAINRNYRFGVELDTVVLRPDGLHYLSVPILLGWERNRHQLEAGLLVDFLTGVHGASGRYVKTGQPATRQFQKSESGWITQTGYRNWVPTAQANYRYRLNRQFSVGVAANFTINSLLEAGSEPSAGGFLLKETNRFFLSGQVVYLIR